MLFTNYFYMLIKMQITKKCIYILCSMKIINFFMIFKLKNIFDLIVLHTQKNVCTLINVYKY